MSSLVRQDALARAEAQTRFDRPLLIEAGAGTGKTAVLVARILAWTLGPGWERRRDAWIERKGLPPGDDELASEVLRRTVAITFTEAAAAEMTTRVAEALVAVHEGEAVVGLDPDALPADRELVRARAQALVGALGQLGTRTIHSFCRRLLARHPLEAGLHPDVSVDADGQEQAATVRLVLEEELPRIWGQGDVARALRVAALGPGDLEQAVCRLLSDGARAEDLAEAPLAPDRVARFAAEVEDRLGALLVAVAPGAGIKRADSVAKAAVSILEAVITSVAKFGAGAIGPEELDAELAMQDLPKLVKRIRQWRNGVIGKDEAKAGIDAASTTAAAERALGLAVALGQAHFGALEAVHDVVRTLLVESGERLRARGVLTYGDLLRGARDLLVGHPGVASQVRGEIDQLMVDEFQDTDLLQCEILEELAFGPETDPRPVLFVVGDPKQSIYGWRNADLRAFERFKQRIARSGEVLPLVVNFRSVPALLDEVERVVAPVMTEVAGVQPKFQKLEPCEERRCAGGFEKGDWRPVEYWAPARAPADLPEGGDAPPAAPRFIAERHELEGEALAADLVRLRDEGEVPLGEIGVLVRTTTSLDPIVSALRHAGIPFVAERETEFYERREIVDATALLRTILDPNDHVALVTALRSPLVGLPDAALLPLWQANVHELLSHLGAGDSSDDEDVAPIREAVRSAAERVPTDVPGIDELGGWPAAFERFARALAPLRREARDGTPDRFVEGVRNILQPEATEAARYLGRYRVAHLDRLFRDLIDALDAHGGSPAAVAAWLRRSGSVDREHREGRARTVAEDAVQIMTIHRAKGLDFRQVYLLQAGKGAGGRPGEKETMVFDRGGEAEWILCNLPSLGHWRHREQREAVEVAERVRLLYVALTRAKERLVVSGLCPDGKPKPGSQTELLDERAGDRAGLASLEDGVPERIDSDGVRWRWAFGGAALAAKERPEGGAPGAWDWDGEARRWDALEAEAHSHAARSFSARASDVDHGGADHSGPDLVGRDSGDSDSDGSDSDGTSDAGALAERTRRVAMAAGTVVHGLLEDLAGGIAEPDLEDWVQRSALPSDRDTVAERARSIWQRFRAGPLHERLASLGERVVARELPVLVAPEERVEAPVGFVSGSIDLVYREPDGSWVVVDYKTDAVDGDRLRERAQVYAGQGAAYARALQRALQLEEPPRFELWFLQASTVVDSMGNPLD